MTDGKTCVCKKTHRDESERKNMINRLNRIEGQIRGIKGMVSSDTYCVDILTQVLAATSALKSFSNILLTSHIKTCVADGLRDGDTELIDELINTIEKFMR
jgi:DNA-binding FrmR family transcriptional regulator